MSDSCIVKNEIRYDLSIIESWIADGSKVLGLGCGDGELLHALKRRKGVIETGIEQDESLVACCIQKGLSVIQGDFNAELTDYPDGFFDYVICSQTLQQVYTPPELIAEMLRIGKKVVVSFPNFCHWRIRLQMLISGHVPRTKELPYEWYNTPNIRVLSLDDFRGFSRELGFRILKEAAINSPDIRKTGREVKVLSNLRATYGLYLIAKNAT